MRSYARVALGTSPPLGTLAAMGTLIAWGIAAALALSAGAKIFAPGSRSELDSLGIRGAAAQTLAWAAAIAAELSLAALLILGFAPALLGASALFSIFAVIQFFALRRGAAGRPCGCLGRRGTVSWRAVLGNLMLAILAGATYVAVALEPGEEALVITGFALLTLAVAALATAVAALARELGIVKLALQSGGALEIESEGPELGEQLQIGRWFDTAGRDMALAVFTSSGCPVCRSLGPSIDFVARDPQLAVLRFDEEVDQDAWNAFAAPGAPYAVALDRDGTVLAKGIPNSLPQLESIVATAVRRRAESAHA